MHFMNLWRQSANSEKSRSRKQRLARSRYRRGLHRPEALEQRAVLTASIGNFVWNDLNTDGIQDALEPGVENVTVQLLNSSNTVIGTTTTNSMGNYSFTGLAAGTYSIKTTAPTGFGFSPADQGGNDAADSDHLAYLGQTAPFTLGATDNLSIDIGLSQKFTVDIPDVTWVSSLTTPLVGYVDVKFANVPGMGFVDNLSAYNAGIILTPVGGASPGVTWHINSMEMKHDAIEPDNAIFPGQNPQDFTTSGNLHYIADNLPAVMFPAVAENQILNNQGIFRLQFTVPAGATGDYQLTFDPDNTLFFDALSNQITNIDLSGGTLHIVPAISVTSVTTTANEGNGGTPSRSFDVTLSHASTQTITVLVNTVDGTATAADGDFTPIVNQLLTFAPGGPLTQTVTVAVNGDNKVELDESFTLALSSATNAVIQGAPAATTLVNDDSATITVSSEMANELNSGSALLGFTVSLSNPVDVPVMVTLNTADGTAVLGSDFTSSSTVLTFNPNDPLSQTYSVGILGDNTVEATETFSVTLSAPSASGRSVSSGTAGTGTITNDDSALVSVTSVAGNSSVFEGNPTAANVLNFTVALSNPVDVDTTVTISTATGTAVATDFTGSTVTHTFTAGQTSFNFPVTITSDNIVELDESFSVGLSTLVPNSRAVMLDSAATTVNGVIQNDDSATITVSSETANELNSGSALLGFTVSLSNPVDVPVMVTLNTLDGTAVLGSDFTSSSTVLTFNPNDPLTQTYNVGISGDNIVELTETFSVTLSGLANGGRNVSAGSDGTGTITNDDMATITVNSEMANELNSGSALLGFTVSLSNPVDVPVMVTLNTADGTAVLGSDFTSSSTVLTFNPNDPLSQTYSVGILGDNTVEATETFSVTLSALSASGRSVSSGTAGTGTITNDDSALVSVTSVAGNSSVFEGNPTAANVLNFTVALSNPVDVDTTVTISTATGTAVATDFTGSTVTHTFTAGQTSFNFPVTITSDNIVELDESFSVGLSTLVPNSRAVSLDSAATTALGVIQNDDTATITVNSLTVDELNTGNTPLGFTVSLSNPVDVAVSVTVNTADVTAVLGSDFTSSSTVLTFAANSTTPQTYSVDILGDNTVEATESFSVTLAAPSASGRSVSSGAAGTGTITNDDSATITVTNAAGNATTTEGQTGDSNVLNFIVTLSNPVDEATTVTINTALLTPGLGIAAANDFIANTVTHTFGIGQTTFTFPVTMSGDLLNEVDEQFSVNLVPGSLVTTRSVSLGSGATGTILNDDFDVTGPKVTGIYVRSTSWTTAYLNRLATNGVGDATLGYRLDVGAAQLHDLPWINLNQISITFNEEVIISNDDIKLRGVNVTDYALSGAYLTPTTTTVATWNLGSAIGRDKLLVQLNSSATTGVVDINGLALDGNSLTNNTSYSAFPTGDGVNGGDLTFRFDVLPGNADRGVAPGTAGVFGGDVTRVRDTQFFNILNSAYPIYHDVDGSGGIFGGDVTNVRDRQFTNLPIGEPTSGSFLMFFSQLAEEDNQLEPSSLSLSSSSSSTLANLNLVSQVQPTQAAMYWYALGMNQTESSAEIGSTDKKKNWIDY